MLIIVFSENDLFTFRMISVFIFKLTFFYKMLFDLFDLDYLFTFPASCKHGAITPVMHI